MTDLADVRAFYMQSIRDFCQTSRERMTPDQNAIIDAIVMIELAKRNNSQDYYLELRLVAEKHRKTSPYLSSCLKCLADLHKPLITNIVPIFKTTPPGGKPCP